MAEIEMKLLIDEDEAQALWRRARAAGLARATPRARLLRTVYHDTPDRRLQAAGVALRIRRDGRRWIQTVKAKANIHGGLSRTGEWETPAPGGRVNPRLIEDEAVRARVIGLVGEAPLSPVCETRIRRAAGEVTTPGGGRAELAVDLGEIVAGARAAPIREVEIELIEGPLGGLFDIARALFPEGGLRFSRLSKAARGYLLAAEGRIDPPLAPRNARRVALSADQTAEQAARDVLRECFAQIEANMETARELDDPEGPHQLRVGLRRLRSAFSVFGPVVNGPTAARLGAEAKWLGAEVGRVRDLDVAHDDLVARAAERRPEEPGFAVILAALVDAARTARADLRATLAGRRAQEFVFDLAEFIETRGWLAPDDFDQTVRLAQPVEALARQAMARCWKHSAKRAKGLETLTIAERHELRKSLKKQRYAIEFLSPLFGAKRVAPFLKRLKALQLVFGDLNDLAMAEEMFTGPGAIGAGDPAAQRAIGRMLGAGEARAEEAWRGAAALWRDLAAARPFWK